MSKTNHKHHPLTVFSSKASLAKGFSVVGYPKNHASATPAVTGPGWWQIVEENTPGIFTPATDVFPPDALWNDGSTVLPGEDGWTLDAILAELDLLQVTYGRDFGANFQWPEA